MSSSTNFFQGLASYYNLHPKHSSPYTSSNHRNRFSSHTTSYIPLFIGAGTHVTHNDIHLGTEDWAGRGAYESAQRESSRQTTAAAVGGIGMVILSGILAYVTKNYFKASKELKKAEDFKFMLPSLALEEGFQLGEVLPIVNKHIEIVENKRSQSRNIVVLTGTVLAAAAGAFVGGMFAAAWLITASIVVGVFALATGAFLVVWHWDDETSLPPYMQNQIQTFLKEHTIFSDQAI
ncbi:MAG TPA: hypothetical protein DCE71_06785 [Parachlamydiales bacterium]|nr:hypothetical protein [Parachlamydiales bacterium]